MREKIEESGVEVQGIELIDFGDAAEETKQTGIPVINDSCCTFTFSGEE